MNRQPISQSMKMFFILASLLVLAITVVPAIVDGQRRFRWGTDTEIQTIEDRLEAFPREIDGWETISDTALDRSAIDELQPFAYVNRVYYHPETGRQAQVFLLLGPTGPTAVHTPEVCISSRAFRIVGKPQVVPVGTRGGQEIPSVESTFQSRDANSTWLRSWHAWTVDGPWQAPPEPRFWFADSRYLFKVQIVGRFADRQQLDDDRGMKDFVAAIQGKLAELAN